METEAVLVDPRFGERYAFLETAEETGGELVRVRVTAAPGEGRRPASAHPYAEERFGVESGTLGLVVGGEERVLGAGEEAVVPPGVRHLPRNAGGDELRLVIEMRPAGRFEEFVRAITEANATGREGLPYLLTAAPVLHRFGDVERPTRLPRPLERALFAVLAAVGRMLGYDPQANPREKAR